MKKRLSSWDGRQSRKHTLRGLRNRRRVKHVTSRQIFPKQTSKRSRYTSESRHIDCRSRDCRHVWRPCRQAVMGRTTSFEDPALPNFYIELDEGDVREKSGSIPALSYNAVVPFFCDAELATWSISGALLLYAIRVPSDGSISKGFPEVYLSSRCL